MNHFVASRVKGFERPGNRGRIRAYVRSTDQQMKVNDDLALIKLPMALGGQVRELNLCLILDAAEGATLVDTGLPGQEDLILEALGDQKLGRIVLTHHDIDHVGSAAALKELKHASVLTSELESPFVEGKLPGQKVPPPERLAQMPEFKQVLDAKRAVTVDEFLSDGQILEVAGGVRVIFTPGHTVGHLSLFLERSKTLITGDALVSENGILFGPVERATPDMESASASVKKLAELTIETIVCYHGGLVTDDADGQLKKLAATL